jgi:nicotinamidase-related amidase
MRSRWPRSHQDCRPPRGLDRATRGRDDVDLIYVNDNYGDFTADFDDIVRSALAGERPDLVEPIVPVPGSLVVTKVRHSVFYASTLEYLLRRLEAQQIVLTGQVTDSASSTARWTATCAITTS